MVRVLDDDDIVLHDYHIPAGTPIFFSEVSDCVRPSLGRSAGRRVGYQLRCRIVWWCLGAVVCRMLSRRSANRIEMHSLHIPLRTDCVCACVRVRVRVQLSQHADRGLPGGKVRR